MKRVEHFNSKIVAEAFARLLTGVYGRTVTIDTVTNDFFWVNLPEGKYPNIEMVVKAFRCGVDAGRHY